MNPEQNQARPKLTLSLDLRVLSVLLLVLLVGLTLYTKPWNGILNEETRKITISGEATLKEEPDEYVFNPSWEKSTQDEITALNDSAVKALKDLGVADGDIKNNASVYEDYKVYPATEPDQPGQDLVRTLSLTITVDNKELAQKVQDYLLTTDPQGTITPYAQFSNAKQKELEDKARTEAIADARKRAETTADGLEAKVGKVLEVSEGWGGSCANGLCSGAALMAEDTSTRSSLSVQPGENEFTYTVQVVFELK
jgi:uncharacterized protein YggE